MNKAMAEIAIADAKVQRAADSNVSDTDWKKEMNNYDLLVAAKTNEAILL